MNQFLASDMGLPVRIHSHRGACATGCAKNKPHRYAKLRSANEFAPTNCLHRIWNRRGGFQTRPHSNFPRCWYVP